MLGENEVGSAASFHSGFIPPTARASIEGGRIVPGADAFAGRTFANPPRILRLEVFFERLEAFFERLEAFFERLLPPDWSLIP
jgi:hypothetical protein